MPTIGRPIYIVTGQHPGIGPNRLSAHATRAGAVRTATEWTNIFLSYQKRPANATPRNWRFFYRDQPLVWIDETVLNR